MGKELSEMSLEELWGLFPVFLVPHNDKWNIFYDEMESFLKSILSECPIERISHIGSTAISGIWAKDIVDVLIEVSKVSKETAKNLCFGLKKGVRRITSCCGDKPMLKKYKMSFEIWGLLLFLIIMLQNFIWFAIPAPNDILRANSITETIDTVAQATVYYIL